jgi:hypothetical protein
MGQRINQRCQEPPSYPNFYLKKKNNSRIEEEDNIKGGYKREEVKDFGVGRLGIFAARTMSFAMNLVRLL